MGFMESTDGDCFGRQRQVTSAPVDAREGGCSYCRMMWGKGGEGDERREFCYRGGKEQCAVSLAA